MGRPEAQVPSPGARGPGGSGERRVRSDAALTLDVARSLLSVDGERSEVFAVRRDADPFANFG